jgi:hypothetical protein
MPYHNHIDFELTEFLYKTVRMSAGSIDTLSQLIHTSVIAHGTGPDDINLFACNADLLATIDTTLVGDIPWKVSQTRSLFRFSELTSLSLDMIRWLVT